MQKSKAFLSFTGLLWALFCSSTAWAQISEMPPANSARFPVDSFISIVKRHHPVAVQARLLRQQARAERLKAAGKFDPKLFSDIQEKRFKETDYFQLHNSGLEIPSWFGLKAKAGYERNQGAFLNEQNTVPGSGLWYGEISLTLIRGLFIDERRAALRQAQLLQESAEFEIELALNQLLEEALIAYWDWYQGYRDWQLMAEAVDLARVRLQAVRRGAAVGEMPMIDTLEARIQWQDRRLRYQEAEANFLENRNLVANFLWLEGVVPLQIQQNTIPLWRDPELLNLLPTDWLEQHPQLQFYRIKMDRLDLDRRLAVEQLKPQVDLSYKFLNQPTQNDFFAEYSPNNYQFGLRASFPVFLRSGRGEVMKTKLKLQETDLEQELKRLEITNKVQALELQLQLTGQQVQESRSITANYLRLLRAEQSKFFNGESSLFLVNAREIKYLEAREKLIALEQKVNAVQAKLLSAAGILYNP